MTIVMKRYLSYGLMLLVTVFSCSRERETLDAELGSTVDIRVSIADLQATKATIPGDGWTNDGGGFADYYMSFEAPAECDLSVWASDGAQNYSVAVLAGGVTTTKLVNSSSSLKIDFDDIPEGRVTIYPVGGSLKIYKISYTHAGGTKTWDFNEADFKALLSPINPLQPHPALGTAGSWNVTLDGLTIWSNGNSTWNAGGYFEWGGGYTAPDLVILIANSAGNIVRKYPGSHASLTSKTGTDAVITFDFEDIASGNYTVYAFGNTDGLWPMTYDPEDDSINLSGSDLTTLETATQVENLRFRAQLRNQHGWENATLYASDPVQCDDGVSLKNGRLPMSAKASLKVSSGKNGEAHLELLRCVAKVTAVIINNTGQSLTLYNYKHTVHDINPTTGYVIPHDEDFIGDAGNLVANPCLKYDNDNFVIPIGSERSQAYDWYVFPSNGPFKVCIQFTMFKGQHKPADENDEHTYTYNDLPVTNWRQVNIPSLSRNQHLTVTTRISKGVTVSFNFDIAPWTEHTSSVHFD